MRRSVRLGAGAALMIVALAGCGDDADVPVTPEAADVPDPRIRVELEVRARSAERWMSTIVARPGQLLRFRVSITNRGARAQRARVRLELDRALALVPASAFLRRGERETGGRPLTPGLARRGVVIGTLPPGRTNIVFTLRVAPRIATPRRLAVGASIGSYARRTADTLRLDVRAAARRAAR